MTSILLGCTIADLSLTLVGFQVDLADVLDAELFLTVNVDILDGWGRCGLFATCLWESVFGGSWWLKWELGLGVGRLGLFFNVFLVFSWGGFVKDLGSVGEATTDDDNHIVSLPLTWRQKVITCPRVCRVLSRALPTSQRALNLVHRLRTTLYASNALPRREHHHSLISSSMRALPLPSHPLTILPSHFDLLLPLICHLLGERMREDTLLAWSSCRYLSHL